MNNSHLSDVPFTQLNLHPKLLQSIEEIGFFSCTPIQAKSLPIALAGHDVCGQAQTGTGKTAAFLLAVFDYLLKNPASSAQHASQPRALILAPTRELAIQIHKDALMLGKHTEFRFGLIYGGTGYDAQRTQLQQGVDIIIGTPGRIIDYFKQRIFNLKAIQTMVLDEADRMFDLGFIKDIRFLLRRMPAPQNRLSLLFSATLSLRICELAYEHMNNPQQISITPEKMTADHVKETAYFPAKEEKIPLLLGLLKEMDTTRTLIFVNTKRAAEEIDAYLKGNNVSAAVLSGDVPQKKRIRLLDQFCKGKLLILIATDVAARGLHIPEVSHVINYDLPQDPQDYVHRIGRTARAGATGDAISFVCDEFAFSMMDIENYIGHRIPVTSIQEDLLLVPKPPSYAKRIKRSSKAHKKRSKRPAKP